MRRIFNILMLISAAAIIAGTQGCSWHRGKENQENAKYVFLFIGDGMGLAQTAMAEIYMAAKQGKIGSIPVSFTEFPVYGLVSTYSADNYITCSSAAGTALSTGVKTRNNMLGMAPDTTALKSIAYKIHEKGYKIGIMSDVPINHATPAAFYANVPDRENYYDIALQLPESGFEFFAGGGFLEPEGKNHEKKSAYDACLEKGYYIARGLDEFNAIGNNSGKIILLQESGKSGKELPYRIDRKKGDMSLNDLVKSAISRLENEKGFFIMAEGGKIDWAGHQNDTKTDILEVLNLSEAVETAVAFYKKHPDETLIIVTADHETGGLSLGYGENYILSPAELDQQKSSFEIIGKEKTDEFSKKANVGWAGKTHTGIYVPVYAIGKNSCLFSGKSDNTDIPKKICKAMGIQY